MGSTGHVAGRPWKGPTPRLQPKAPTMQDASDRHDAHALALIDEALTLGRFSETLVAAVAEAFAAAEQAERAAARY